MRHRFIAASMPMLDPTEAYVYHAACLELSAREARRPVFSWDRWLRSPLTQEHSEAEHRANLFGIAADYTLLLRALEIREAVLFLDFLPGMFVEADLSIYASLGIETSGVLLAENAPDIWKAVVKEIGPERIEEIRGETR